MIFNLHLLDFSFLRMSTIGFTAQAYGAENNRGISKYWFEVITNALVAAFLLILLQRPIAWFSRSIIDSGTETINLALDYLFVRIWAVPRNPHAIRH
jgi:MATE family multidrug resistance protein